MMLIGLLVLSGAFFIVGLPRLLVLNNSSRSDYIAVLDGHDGNYYEGLRLLQAGMAKRMFVCLDMPDVPLSSAEIRQDLAFIRRTARNLAGLIDICENEDQDALTELRSLLETNSARRVLIVTPAFESRAKYIVASRRFPNLSWSVHASRDSNFNVNWWRCREWADTYFRSIGSFAAALREPQRAEASVERSAN